MKRVLLAFALASLFAAAFPAGAFAAEETAGINHTLRAGEITVIDETSDLGTKLSDGTEEDYYPNHRQWNGISTVVRYGNNIFVAWYTGGNAEPHSDNYIAVAASTDNGETWVDPFLIVDPVDSSCGAVLPVFFVNAEGELFLYYSILPGANMFGIRLLDAGGALSGITYEGPFRCSARTPFVKPTVLSDGTVMYVTGDEDGYSGVYRSSDGGYSYTRIAQIRSAYTKPTKTYTEASVVEKNDGTLWMLSRLEKGAMGGMEQSFSVDGGLTWTVSEGNLEHPLQGPGSRAAFVKLQSGAFALVTNDNTGARDNMTVFLSEDEGVTWPYSIVIDRLVSAYPEIDQAPDGTIYIAYDKGRYTENSIRLTILTEEDIKAGKFVSAAARDKLTVTKLNAAYADIVSVNGAFEKEYVFSVGTSSDRVRETLPDTFTVTDSNGEKHTLSGVWKSAGYKQEQAGTYVLTFNCDLPNTLLDSFDLLRVRVTLTAGGCNSGIRPAGAALLSLVAFGAAAASVCNKKH